MAALSRANAVLAHCFGHQDDPEDTNEISQPQAMQFLWQEEQYADIILQSNDGERIPAIRCILASRSPVFRSMLYGHFLEANSSTIALSFSGKVLRGLVQYIYTNECNLLVSAASHDPGVVPSLIELAKAANFFWFTKLLDKILVVTTQWMEKEPDLSLLVLANCSKAGSFEIESLATYFIRTRMRWITFKSKLITSLETHHMTMILQDDDLECTEMEVLLFFVKWVAGNRRKRRAGGGTPLFMYRKRAEMALAKHIRLYKIPERELRSIEKLSSFVEDADLRDAFAFHKMHRETYGYPRSFDRRLSRDMELIRTPGEPELYLHCIPLTCGTFELKIAVDRLPEKFVIGFCVWSVEPGLIMKVAEVEGFDPEIWCWFSDGRRLHETDDIVNSLSPVDLACGEGSVVTLQLNLQAPGHGTFRASVDDGPFVMLFPDIRGSQGRNGFVPALRYMLPNGDDAPYNAASVRLLEFRAK